MVDRTTVTIQGRNRASGLAAAGVRIGHAASDWIRCAEEKNVTHYYRHPRSAISDFQPPVIEFTLLVVGWRGRGCYDYFFLPSLGQC